MHQRYVTFLSHLNIKYCLELTSTILCYIAMYYKQQNAMNFYYKIKKPSWSCDINKRRAHKKGTNVGIHIHFLILEKMQAIRVPLQIILFCRMKFVARPASQLCASPLLHGGPVSGHNYYISSHFKKTDLKIMKSR